MQKQLFKLFFLCVLSAILYGAAAVAQPENGYYSNQTKLVSQQIDLLKSRLAQTQNELKTLQKQQDSLGLMAPERITKQTLGQIGLDISVAKSNLDSINIELTECQQAVSRLEKDTQELQNQLNVANIFGLKIARNGLPDVNYLRQQLEDETALLQLEKARANYLLQLQTVADNTLKLQKIKYARIETLFKSQSIIL